MPGTGFIFCVLLFFFCNISKADPPGHFVVVGGGVIVYTNAPFTGNSTAVKLQVIAPNIVRVIAAPGKELAPSKSLITIFEKDPKLVWNVLGKEKITLKTAALTVVAEDKMRSSLCMKMRTLIIITRKVRTHLFALTIPRHQKHYHCRSGR